jgi:hypothetical protein
MIRRLFVQVAIVILVTVSFTAQTSSAAAAPADNEDPQLDSRARATTAGCEEELKNIFSNSFDLGVCLGVLKGLHYLSADVCVPPALTLSDIAGILSRYFEASEG